MRTTKFQRITALILTVVLIFGGVFTVGAKSTGRDGSTLSAIKELLNAISYNDYRQSDEFLKAQDAQHTLEIDGIEGVYTNEAGDVIATKDLPAEGETPNPNLPRKFEADGKVGLYIPDAGTVTWTTDALTEALRYTIAIEYYPVANKAASIERIFMINGKVPFAEARYLNISKIWTTPYPLARTEVPKGVSAATMVKEATDAGFAGVKEEKSGDKTYVVCQNPTVWTKKMSEYVSKYSVRFFRADIDQNEIRESLVQTPAWQTYSLKDSNGFTQDPFVFVIEPDSSGKVSLSLEGVNEPIVISKILLTPATTYTTYKQYSASCAGQPKGDGVMKIEAEYFSAASDQTIYPVSDTTSAATSPSATDKTLINVVGGEKWQAVGQWLEYDFSVSKSGMYNIAMRYKQNILDGMSVARSLYLYSGDGIAQNELGYYNGIPFEEAASLKFGFKDSWQSGKLGDEENGAFSFYFKEGVTYKLRLEVTLGDMGDIVRRVQESLDSINADYLNILKLTGTTPDEFHNYDFYRTIPKTMGDMYDQYKEISAIADIITKEAATKSSMTATLVNVADLLKEMASDEDEVAKNLVQLKTYIGSLGTWLGDAKTQPLLLDYITVQSPDEEAPKAEAGFFASLWHEISGFWYSFWRQYDRMGALTEKDTEETVEVWLAYGRDQSQVIRNLINNKFTAQEGITVNLKLVAGGTLLPSILARKGPDVYLGLGSGDVINYAIRGALESVENMEGYEEACSNFNEEAMMVLRIEDAKGVEHCYGLPETQGFAMMFVREDILAELDIEIPKTWDDVKAAIPVLQANNMEIAMSADSNIFIYQNGGELFADNGMRINLDSRVALKAFEDMCAMFTMYSFPYRFDFANRFRTGEMPIGFADYTGTYNHLKVFATEIEGLWSFYPLPGIENEKGEINNDSVSGVSAVVMITGSENKENSWRFMKWYVGAECQTDYSNEMVAILGPSAKHATANKKALESLPWTRDEYKQIKAQFDNLAAIPNYPGAYIVGRYTTFAFLDAYNDNQDPASSLLGYIDYINDEITRKRAEFGLETLDKTLKQTTLAVKRMQQAEAELDKIRDSSSYSSSYDAVLNSIDKALIDYKTEDYGNLEGLARELEALNAELFANAIKYLRDAATCLRSYEAYK